MNDNKALSAELNETKLKVQDLKNKNAELQNRILQMVSLSQSKENSFSINDAWVKLYEYDNFKGRETTIKYPRNIRNFKEVNFHNKVSSVKWKIPIGWKVLLFEHDSHSGEFVVLEGTNEERSYTDIKRQIGRGDETSSLKWVLSGLDLIEYQLRN